MKQLFDQLMSNGCRNGAVGLVLDLVRSDRHADAVAIVVDVEFVDRWVKLCSISDRHARYRALPEIEAFIDDLMSAKAVVPEPEIEPEPKADPVPVVAVEPEKPKPAGKWTPPHK